MISRRKFLYGVATVGIAGTDVIKAGSALAHHTGKKKRFTLNPKYLPQTVSYRSRYKKGTIVVDANARYLYLVEGWGRARRYGVGVGRAALAWSGTAMIKRKAEWPRWTPTKNMIKREPHKYAKYAKGVPGGPNNPLGARALYLYEGNRDTYYRIHGTNQPWSIGTASSNGCIRMVNDHAIDLYNRTPIGTMVVVLTT
ncbi:MAG: L,D-transpeptidase [Pseudomonadota bacterium]